MRNLSTNAGFEIERIDRRCATYTARTCRRAGWPMTAAGKPSGRTRPARGETHRSSIHSQKRAEARQTRRVAMCKLLRVLVDGVQVHTRRSATSNESVNQRCANASAPRSTGSKSGSEQATAAQAPVRRRRYPERPEGWENGETPSAKPKKGPCNTRRTPAILN